MSLLQRLANVPLDSLPLAHPSDACFQRFGPIGYEHKDGTLPWEVLETALVEAFKCPSNPEEEELKSGPLGLELVIKAFQSLKEELEDEQHEIERDTWIVCLTRAVNAKIETSSSEGVDRRNQRRASAPPPPEALERALQLKQDEEEERQREAQRQEEARKELALNPRPDMAASPRSLVYDDDDVGCGSGTNDSSVGAREEPIASGSGLARADVMAFARQPQLPQQETPGALVNPGIDPALIYERPATRSAVASQEPEPRSLRPRASIVAPAILGQSPEPPQRLSTRSANDPTSKGKAGKTKSALMLAQKATKSKPTKAKPSPVPKEKGPTWVQIIAQSLAKRSPQTVTQIQATVKSSLKGAKLRKPLVRTLQQNVAFYTVGENAHGEALWALDRAWLEHSLAGHGSIRDKEESNLWCWCRRPSSDGPMILCVGNGCPAGGWIHCHCAGDPPEYYQEVDWYCSDQCRQRGRADSRDQSMEL